MDIREPEAPPRYAAASEEYDLIASQARKAATGVYDPLPAPMIAFLAATYRSQRLSTDADERSGGLPRGRFNNPDSNEASVDFSREVYAEQNLPKIVGMYGVDADRLTAAQGLRVDTETPTYTQLCHAILVADIEAATLLWVEIKANPSPRLQYL